MSTAIQVFDFGGRKVRTAGTHDAPLFCAADVCAVLEISDVSDACERLDGDELASIAVPAKNSHTGVQGRLYKTTYVTESGLFSLILGSRKPEAKKFKKWITSEVLPAIRKHGFYDALLADSEKRAALLLTEIFPNLPGRAKPIFSELIASLLRLRGEVGTSGNPPWARGLARTIYGWAIPVVGEQSFRRTRNPAPNGSRVDYSMLNDVALERVKRVAEHGSVMARVSIDWDDWRTKMEIAFGSKAVQLPMLVPMLASPRKGQ